MSSQIPAMITADWLYRRRACQPQIDRFVKEWPDGAAVSLNNLQRAAELRLNISWLAEQLLCWSALVTYCRAERAAWLLFKHALSRLDVTVSGANFTACIRHIGQDYYKAKVDALWAALNLEVDK